MAKQNSAKKLPRKRARTTKSQTESKRARTGRSRNAMTDEYSVIVPSQLDSHVPGGDHLLLAAFPLAVSRPGRAGVRKRSRYLPGQPYKVIQDNVTCATTGRQVTRTLEVYGSKGPIQPSDEDVLVALIQFTHEYLASSPGATLIITDNEILRSGGDPVAVMMRLRKIHFKRADLLRRLGIKHLSGKNQQLLEQRMQRLSGVDLAVKNAYFNADGTLVTNVGLRLIDSYAFLEGNRYAWFTWSPTMAQLIENGELRALDTDFYFRINDFLARRLFRHLNIFGRPGKSVYPFSEIVKTRLGLEPSTQYVSKCKEPVERACRELVRHQFLRSYRIDGRYVDDATITLEMPDDYQPSLSFALPFEAIIDSFRRDAEEVGGPIARGGLWRKECEKLEKLTARSPKARAASGELTRLVYDRYGPSAFVLRQTIGLVDKLALCGIRLHTAVPEVLRLVQNDSLTPEGLNPEVQNAIDWWMEKKRKGENVGPGLLVSVLREPGRVTESVESASTQLQAEPDDVGDGADDVPTVSLDADVVWQPILERMQDQVGPAAMRDWLVPLVPVSLTRTLANGSNGGGRAAGYSLTLWAPNTTFSKFLSGKTKVADTLRQEAASIGVVELHFATNA